MRTPAHLTALIVSLLVLSVSCSRAIQPGAMLAPTQVIDLGALVTDTLPQHFWGKALLKQMNFSKQNSVELIKWTVPAEGGNVSGSNAYYTLFNHGGPHVDAPNHVGVGGGIDSYHVESFSGPAKVFDASSFPSGRSIPANLFQGHVQPGDIVLVLTRYQPPARDDVFPEVKTLTHEAAEFLASLPIRAYGTDAWGVESLNDTKLPLIHQSLLSKGIPVYEQLLNLDKLLGRNRLFFVGVPLNMKDGDGMMVRPVVFVY